jgi:hypothetical protein
LAIPRTPILGGPGDREQDAERAQGVDLCGQGELEHIPSPAPVRCNLKQTALHPQIAGISGQVRRKIDCEIKDKMLNNWVHVRRRDFDEVTREAELVFMGLGFFYSRAGGPSRSILAPVPSRRIGDGSPTFSRPVRIRRRVHGRSPARFRRMVRCLISSTKQASFTSGGS